MHLISLSCHFPLKQSSLRIHESLFLLQSCNNTPSLHAAIVLLAMGTWSSVKWYVNRRTDLAAPLACPDQTVHHLYVVSVDVMWQFTVHKKSLQQNIHISLLSILIFYNQYYLESKVTTLQLSASTIESSLKGFWGHCDLWPLATEILFRVNTRDSCYRK